MVNVLADIGLWSLLFRGLVDQGLDFLIRQEPFAIPRQDLRVLEEYPDDRCEDAVTRGAPPSSKAPTSR